MQTMSNEYCKIVRDRCMCQKSRSGEFSFCEAVKVDMGASKDKKWQRHLSSTISLLQVLFEDLGLAASLYNESADRISHVQILKPEIHLFNKANDDEDPGFLFGEGIITDFSGVKMESLKLLESWCLFAYREFNMNVLVLLKEFNEMIYGSKTKSDVLNRFCDFFQMNDDRIHDHLIQWYKNNDSDQGFSYEVVFDMMKHDVQAGNGRPLQLKLSHILSLSAITDSIGQGWNAVKISRYFGDITNDKEKQKFKEKQKMKTSRQFEEAFILLLTVKQMKFTLTE